ncbi:glycosyltransferase family 4 protein [Massilia sp. YIM B02443]|uniref:glycosyltransferase family 4 protein n=1 Tax=Massilia sp. YIM B02443 TaxID=3050127 RepID=UPI0025B6DFEC|nr:glycosyltransferase family 4 protein [Massilia sp. YIM B02443]MDN4036607.1 glycosyltransferase family 4 protein [Massilia sp. YIM B02443]
MLRRMSGAPRVLMVGTALDGRGGVAAAIGVLRAAGLFEREGVAYVATHAGGARRAKLASAGRGLWRAARLCLRPGAGRRPAIVHVHAASHASFVRKSLVLLLGRLAGAHTIFHLHGGGFRRFAQDEAGPLLRRWIRHTLEASSRVIALSGAWAGFVREFAPRARVEVVPNAVPLPALADARPAPGSEPEAGRILFLGRVTPAKGVGELLEAAAALAPHHPQLRLVLAGEGSIGDIGWARRRAGELGIASRVEWPGWLDGAARDAELARAWLFCLPSHAEGLPMAMLEAMAAGCPVVASRVGGIPEAVRDGVDGLLVDAGDAPALARTLGRVLDEPALRRKLAQAGRQRIELKYSTDIVCGRLAAIYQQLVGAR